jgi:DNA-binding IclR family transcriptional regulator
MQRGEPKTVQAVENACAVLAALQKLGGAGVTELADELSLAKGAVHAQLATLVQQGFVAKDGTTYRLSLRYLDMAEHVKNQFEKFDVVCSEVDSLASETGEVAQFATEEHGRLVYLHKTKGDDAVETASTIGCREYLHCTALGKAILSELPRERVDEIVDCHGLPAKTERTLTTRAELHETLDETRERGYAIDDEENIEGLRCIAAPVVADDEVLGAFSVSGPSSRMTDDRLQSELVETISRSANVIHINYKFS